MFKKLNIMRHFEQVNIKMVIPKTIIFLFCFFCMYFMSVIYVKKKIKMKYIYSNETRMKSLKNRIFIFVLSES